MDERLTDNSINEAANRTATDGNIASDNPERPLRRRYAVVTIKDNGVFLKAYRKGKCFGSESLVMYVINGVPNETSVGFTVTKKHGNAVKRNRIRRKIREAYRLEYPYIRKGYNLVIVAKQSCEYKSSVRIGNELRFLLTKAALIT